MEQSQHIKHVYGAYLNMARQNAFISLSHISKIIGLEESDNKENRLWEMKVLTTLTNNSKADQKVKIIKQLHKHFSFLPPMLDNEFGKKEVNEKTATPKMYYEILTNVFKLLNLFRDQYSHQYFVDDRLENEDYLRSQNQLVYYLKNAFDGSRRKAAERFNFTEADLKFITDGRYKKEDKLDENGNTIVIDKKIQTHFVERDDFFYKLDTVKKAGPENKTYKTLSPKGLTLLICLFLEKKYITLFLDNAELKFFPRNASKEQKKIILEMFSIYRMQLPKARIDSTKSISALGLDMLNELKKCPGELFETLSEEDQDIFRIKAEDTDNENETDSKGNEILMKRYQNRFSYFALRYIDDNELFKDIRFQVSLGKYRYEFYNKKGIDSDTDDRVRSLQKELNGFGRLGKIEEERKEKWAGLIRPFEEIKQDTADEEPYITDHRANYVFNGNRIGLALRETLRTDCFLPEIKGKETNCIPPDAWLSIHELPAMLFHNLLCNKENKGETEKIIKEYIRYYQKLFTDIQKGKLKPGFTTKEQAASYIKENYQLNLNDIPDKICDYLTGKDVNARERFNKQSKVQIERMINWSERQVEKLKSDKKLIGSKDNKIGKDKHVEIKAGWLARFLSEDIVLMQPTCNQGRDKLTGMNFQIMQASLAIYDKSIDELRRMLVSAGLIGNNNPHPFLSNVVDKMPKDTIAFYEIYMKQRIKYLKKCISDGDFTSYSFLYSGRQKWATRNNDFYTGLAKRYAEQPIELPRGLFTEDIKKKLKTTYEKNAGITGALNKKDKDGKEKCNVTFLINEYFTHVCNDSSQPFYNYKRGYEAFDKLRNERNNRRQLRQHYFTLQELEKEVGEDVMNKRIENLANKEWKESNKYGRYFRREDLFKPSFEKMRQACINFKEVDFEPEKKDSLALQYREINTKIKNNKQCKNIDLEKIIKEWEKLRLTRIIKSLLNDYKRNEKVIRQYKIQDMLLFLMAKEILLKSEWGKDNLNEIEQYKLKNIRLDEENSNILSLKIPFSINLIMSDGTSKTIRQESLKLKNYGDFFRFVYDQRIKVLLEQVESIEVDRETLEKELEKYDMKRTAIFKLAQEFEKSIVDKHTEYKEKQHQFKDLLKETDKLTDQEKEDMRVIRNAFCHNNYPVMESVRKIILPEVAPHIHKRFEKLKGKAE
ncbi:MAG: type VI-B CRISPR-associated RNA-guided ribonuclease Cas13b [Tannerella sp.]|jgi:hypothetical protein|nr:type VI-B CRISPR-associated RNA-guided ribonuclease Cas13b [Tannerella sp.]